MTVLIRNARPDDAHAVVDLVQRAFRGDSARGGWTHEADFLDGQRTDLSSVRAILDDPAQHLMLAEQDGGLAGCVTIADIGEGTAYLGMLTVDPARQAAGLGSTLVTAAERAATAAFGARRIEMTVISQRVELIEYYERRGYRQTGEERPFPLDDPRFGLPKRRDLFFVVLAKSL